jgi:hypothetical protein
MREIWNKRRIQDPAFAGYTAFPEQIDMCAKLQVFSISGSKRVLVLQKLIIRFK